MAAAGARSGWRVRRRASAAREETTIAVGDSFSGSFESPRGLRVRGHFEGSVDCGGCVRVEPGGLVAAEVAADGDVVVGGCLSGAVRCGGCLEVLRGGLALGELRPAGGLFVREGGCAADPSGPLGPPAPPPGGRGRQR